MTREKVQHRGRGKLAWLFVAALALAAAAGIFLNIGRWLVVEDPLEHADAIVVLSGGLPYRAVEAAALYAHGLAPEIWLTRPAGPREDLQALGIEFLGEEIYNQKVLQVEGVPANGIRVVGDEIVNTEEEVRALAGQLRSEGKHSVILVTSPPHTRRARAIWKKLVGSDPRAMVRSAPEDPYDAGHWWRSTRDALSVVRETLGLLNTWLGLPVRPATR